MTYELNSEEVNFIQFALNDRLQDATTKIELHNNGTARLSETAMSVIVDYRDKLRALIKKFV